MMISNATTPAKRLMFGYDAGIDAGYIQSTHSGVNVKPLLLNPVGGPVGLGTTSPQAVMHVAQDSVYTSDAAAALLVSSRTTPAKRLLMGYDSGIDAAYLQATQSGVNVKSLLLNPSGGNVGIGLTSPAEKLDVTSASGVAAIKGTHTAADGITYGLFGQSFSSTGIGTEGRTWANGIGVEGLAMSVGGMTNGVGVLGQAGSSHTSGTGVLGQAYAATGTTYGVYGYALSPTGYGVYSDGNAQVAGNLTISGMGHALFFPDGTSQTTAATGGGGGIGGSGTINLVPKFTPNGTTLGNSLIFDNGTNVGIGTTTPTAKLQVNAGSVGTGGFFTTSSTGGRAVYGTATAGSGTTYGIYGTNASGSGAGVYGENTTNTGIGVYGSVTATTSPGYWPGNYGVYGTSASISGVGVAGVATSTGNNGLPNSGGYFSAAGPFGRGVYGTASNGASSVGGYFENFSATGGTGVLGYATDSGSGGAVGVYGQSNSTNGIGVYGRAPFGGYGGSFYSNSVTGVAGYFVNDAAGDIIQGWIFGNLRFKVAGNGNVTADGTFTGGGADFAEAVEPLGNKDRYEPGDVLLVSREKTRAVELGGEAYSTRVAGIYSTKPGVLARPYGMNDPAVERDIPLAVVGIVPCKVSAENGPIQRGDLLVASSKPGYAMKGTDRTRMLGAVVGKALEPLAEGASVIEILVTLE
jgi:hypothetical protein